MSSHGVAAYPLYWPPQYARAKLRRSAAFQVNFTTTRSQLLSELRRLGSSDILISSNIPIRRDGLPYVPDREPEDPSVAVYFNRRSKPFVLACDQFTKVRWNLRAVSETVKALRSIERHGATAMMEQAFSGFAQLPAKTSLPAWRTVLGLPDGPLTYTEIRSRYRELVHIHHPDHGGDAAKMAEIHVAFQDGIAELGTGTP